MDITPLIPDYKLQIQKYGQGKFWTNKGIFEGNIIIYNNAIEVAETELNLEMLAGIDLSLSEIFLIGTGSNFQNISNDVISFLRENKVNFEVMSTPAAVRTYSVLIGEGRDIMGYLYQV